MLCAQIRVLGDEGGKEAAEAQSETDDVFLKKIEATMLTQVRAVSYGKSSVENGGFPHGLHARSARLSQHMAALWRADHKRTRPFSCVVPL